MKKTSKSVSVKFPLSTVTPKPSPKPELIEEIKVVNTNSKNLRSWIKDLPVIKYLLQNN